MEWYLLSQWEAIEIYCRIVAKAEGLPETAFRDNASIVEALRRYGTEDKSTAFMKDIHKRPVDATGKKFFKGKYENLMYGLSSAILQGKPVVQNSTLLNAISEYLNAGLPEDEQVDIMPERHRELKPFAPNDNQRKLENTRWWLYYHEVYEGDQRSSGLVRAILQLLPFGKARITNTQLSDDFTELKEVYTGRYEMYSSNEDYIRMQFKLEKTGKHDLTIVVYVGTSDRATIVLGHYHNLSRTLYSGPILLQRIKKQGRLKPQFFKRSDEEDLQEIDQEIWEFFRDKSRRRTSVPNMVTDLNTLKQFLDRHHEGPDNED